ncbi:glycoside hydrolase [Dendrothele bispora CBS 962.96]|uniref:alpha-1,2-Mannosidase n=1 Tax=Dendrothele bispora (strain CBS 962.96) TaxID=1314807 RepID=A0A4S8KUW2_DENBC|nr:glycoside hydrolase [Dendrothele bispora CBS 962.96]
MSDGSLRKRKKQTETKSKPQNEASAKEPHHVDDELEIDTATLFRYTRILSIPILLFLGVFLYLNPSALSDAVNAFFGFESEDRFGTPGVSGDALFISDVEKRDAVVEAFKHAWRAYERDAMGSDEYHPISQNGSNLTEAGGIGYTVIDSIDTMLIMGLDDDYKRARQWIEDKLDFERDAEFSTFETTIRLLGGLLSAYHLSGNDSIYLDRAIDLADRILPVFDTQSGLPMSQVNLAQRKGFPNDEYPNLVTTAEVATLQLEFRYLSYLTGREEYWTKVESVMKTIKEARMPHGLASIYMDVDSGKFVPSAIRLGSRSDSYYEYLLKQYIQTNYTERVYKDMYDDAIQSVHTHLVKKSPYARMLYTSELIPEQHPNGQLSWRLTPKQDHFVCFFGGSLMLGSTITGANVQPVSVPPMKTELTEIGSRDWQTGTALVKTCWDTHDTATGLAPEVVHFRIPEDGMDDANMHTPVDWYIKGARPGEHPPYDARYILRPETIESLFIAFRLTGDVKYREWGWSIFQAIEKHCKVETGGYAIIINVDEVPSRKEDKMETFLMSETLKYLYLLFDDTNTLPLDKYVLNTEAHPLPIFTPNIRTPFVGH